MLTCKELVARSSELLDGELSFRERMAVRRHLMLCRNCRRFIKQMKLTQAVVRLLPEGQGAEVDDLAAHLAQKRRDSL
ncbi:zf-HC2 domain-containing protein [Pseudomonas sp. JS3066]|uniref:zf-HC2 domain-containing protein n=1 Tax=unclassified Pseudomonas TaxID=196821 RepID=UPI000EA9182B|nr:MULTISPECIES: zf-HC2 domain-containing protein [unclassified Pseudomonas]AYF85773.1 zf-HC2 domain-containing protein [Pseudomonas sp. DY-1]MDH4654962.1 zf-HC2 domain-containing protein [Pseudomonas sp. BN606]MRK19453.1 zf-HC2 domain-containing protein [Pseudomonas sp. JG-B]WVK91643.1 zf-HC2 domain-containing protein [Pseudomonas sp. JS3066]